MASPAAINAVNSPAAGHRRNKSAAVLKSIITPRNHKRSPSDGTALGQQDTPIVAHDTKASPDKGLRKRTKSSVSLRSLGRRKESEPVEANGPQEDASGTPKKTKSTANLVSMFTKSRPKDGKSAPGRDKENTTPPSSAAAPAPPHTPIWAEFSSRPLQEITTTSKVPLNDRRSVEEEIALYSPSNYSPSKQRNFGGYGPPSLQKRPQKERPKSTFLPSTNTTASLFESFSRKRSNDRAPLADTKGNGRLKDGASPRSVTTRGMLRRSSSDGGRRKEGVEPPGSPVKKPNRVMAAVAALNGRSRDAQSTATSPTKLDPKAVEAEFETVLVGLYSANCIPKTLTKGTRNLGTSPSINEQPCGP